VRDIFAPPVIRGFTVEEKASFVSDGFKLDAVIHRPENAKGKVPAFMVLHGFGGNKDGLGGLASARMLESLGYAALRFDFRGCGKSEGARGRTICLEQVEDVKNALTWLATQPGIDGARIGVMGHSFGAAVAVYSAGVDPRIAACISSGGWGDGAKKFRRQHQSPEAWKRFVDLMEEGRRRKAKGEQMMVPRFEIVPIPPALRASLPPGNIMEFPFDVVESMYTFRANDVVDRIAPRPLMLLHSSNDSVTPTEQSIDLFALAGQPTDLHLVAGIDHFGFEEHNPQLSSLVKNWLDKHLPLA
jgi:dipeptidyl aminopeptidase/acylaminoacyl peptidase